jgi:hypothetical protein
VRVTSPPAGTDVALAVNVTVGSAPPLLTVIATVFFADPPGPSACAVNVVFAETVTVWVPDSGSAFELIEGEIVTEVALLDAHVSVTVPPDDTLVVSALNVSVGAGLFGCFGDELPPHAVNSNERVTTLTRKKACAGRRRDTEFLHKPGRDI